MHWIAYTTPGEMAKMLLMAFGFGSMFGFGCCITLWHWSHKRRMTREHPVKYSRMREQQEFPR